MTTANVDPKEIDHFDRQAQSWWDPDGEMATLHAINPTRTAYVRRWCGPLAGQIGLDVGCGGGLLTESLSRAGAQMQGLDLAQQALDAARQHAEQESLEIRYHAIAVESFAEQHSQCFDFVTCMEMLEHVPDPSSVIRACARLVKPGGKVLFSTINRHPKAFALAIFGAEYLTGLVPRGTHDYAKFIRPSELDRWSRDAGLEPIDVSGLRYNPLMRSTRIHDFDVDVNYLMACQCPK